MFRAVARTPNNNGHLRRYPPSLTLMAHEHYYPCHRASYIISRTISTPWGVCSPCCQMCSATSLIKHNYHLCPHRSPFILLGEEKQLWLSALLKDTSTTVTARIRTHILTTRPSEHKSDALNRSAMALHIIHVSSYCTCAVYMNMHTWIREHRHQHHEEPKNTTMEMSIGRKPRLKKALFKITFST